MKKYVRIIHVDLRISWGRSNSTYALSRRQMICIPMLYITWGMINNGIIEIYEEFLLLIFLSLNSRKRVTQDSQA